MNTKPYLAMFGSALLACASATGASAAPFDSVHGSGTIVADGETGHLTVNARTTADNSSVGVGNINLKIPGEHPINGKVDCVTVDRNVGSVSGSYKEGGTTFFFVVDVLDNGKKNDKVDVTISKGELFCKGNKPAVTPVVKGDFRVTDN